MNNIYNIHIPVAAVAIAARLLGVWARGVL